MLNRSIAQSGVMAEGWKTVREAGELLGIFLFSCAVLSACLYVMWL